MHVDMDAFFAACEVLDNPALAGQPLIVGGLGGRGVVATASYEARRYGVHSAMAMAQARKLCPQAVFLAPRMERYSQLSQRIMAIFRQLSPVVEQLSIDEAFLDLTGTEALYGSPQACGRLVKERLRTEVGLTASVGLAPNKFLAKLASDLEKPDGFTVIREEEAAAFIAPLPVGKIYGIGAKAEAALSRLGILRIGQLAAAQEEVLAPIFGVNAGRVRLLAQGIDERPLAQEGEPKSIGREITFAQDLLGTAACQEALLYLSQQLGYRVRRHGYQGRSLTLKVKYQDFQTRSHSLSLEEPISGDEEIYALALRLLGQMKLTKGVRLLGLALGSLTKEEGEGLFAQAGRAKKLNAAVDQIKARFGKGSIARGLLKEGKKF